MSQEIININLKELVLWTENPRDPIDANASDQDVVNQALADRSKLWELNKLARSMGEYYDYSELPIVVYNNNTPIVYDGNRRVILGKIYHKLVESTVTFSSLPVIPLEIPCNVCSQDIALRSILRKHGDSGSWKPLERDIFVFKYKLGDKSNFLLFEEQFGLISKNPMLNQGFVKDEIFKDSQLEKLGFRVENEVFLSQHNKEITEMILNDLIRKVNNKIITTRANRGKVYDILEQETKEWIENDKTKDFKKIKISTPKKEDKIEKKEDKNINLLLRKTKRIKEAEIPIFGGDLYLRKGAVNNLYRDICELHKFYRKEKNLSNSFSCLIRMSLRLLWETAAKNCNKKPDNYINKYFEEAKKNLTQDQKTSLSNNNVTANNIIQLLHTGAHSYQSSQNYEQTIALSIILGAILSISHKKQINYEG